MERHWLDSLLLLLQNKWPVNLRVAIFAHADNGPLAAGRGRNQLKLLPVSSQLEPFYLESIANQRITIVSSSFPLGSMLYNIGQMTGIDYVRTADAADCKDVPPWVPAFFIVVGRDDVWRQLNQSLDCRSDRFARVASMKNLVVSSA